MSWWSVEGILNNRSDNWHKIGEELSGFKAIRYHDSGAVRIETPEHDDMFLPPKLSDGAVVQLIQQMRKIYGTEIRQDKKK